MRRAWILGAALSALAAFMVMAAGPAAGDPSTSSRSFKIGSTGIAAELSGSAEFGDMNLGTNITECPQARLDKYGPLPLERRVRDQVEQYSEGGDDRREDEGEHFFPQNQTS